MSQRFSVARALPFYLCSWQTTPFDRQLNGQRRNLGKAGECGASVSGAGSGRADEEITGEPEFSAVASLIVVDYWTKLML